METSTAGLRAPSPGPNFLHFPPGQCGQVAVQAAGAASSCVALRPLRAPASRNHCCPFLLWHSAELFGLHPPKTPCGFSFLSFFLPLFLKTHTQAKQGLLSASQAEGFATWMAIRVLIKCQLRLMVAPSAPRLVVYANVLKSRLSRPLC